MKNLIKVTQSGSNRELFIPKDKILHFEKLKYADGNVVSVITFQQLESPVYVIDSLESLTQQFEKK